MLALHDQTEVFLEILNKIWLSESVYSHFRNESITLLEWLNHIIRKSGHYVISKKWITIMSTAYFIIASSVVILLLHYQSIIILGLQYESELHLWVIIAWSIFTLFRLFYSNIDDAQQSDRMRRLRADLVSRQTVGKGQFLWYVVLVPIQDMTWRK